MATCLTQSPIPWGGSTAGTAGVPEGPHALACVPARDQPQGCTLPDFGKMLQLIISPAILHSWWAGAGHRAGLNQPAHTCHACPTRARCLEASEAGVVCRRQSSGKPVPGVGLARRVALDVARGLVFLHTRKVQPPGPACCWWFWSLQPCC